MARFVPRQRKHKVKQRLENAREKSVSALQDTNATVISGDRGPLDEDDQRSRLRNRLISQQSVRNSKKKKRLEKYIVGGGP